MTAATGKPRGRPPGQGKVPGSGRKKGSLDRSARLLISEQVAFDILKTYRKLGPDWLFKIAQERPDLFINQCLSKILPPAFKENDPDVVNNTQINLGNDTFETARRIAFVLTKAMHPDPSITVEHAPVDQYHAPPAERVPVCQPEPTDNPAQAEWAASLPLSPQERADQLLIKETKESTLETYIGSAAEHGRGPIRSPGSVDRDPRAAQRDRMLARRRELL